MDQLFLNKEPGYGGVDVQTAGDTGRRTLWVVFVIQAISSLAFYGLAYRVPASRRLFHILTGFITTFATISYFAMAVGQGISLKRETVVHDHDNGFGKNIYFVEREVYWARYVDWSVTTPLLLLDLAMLAGLNGANILVAIVADLVMVLTGLFAAFSETDGPKWGYYAMACFAYLVIVYQLAVPGVAAAKTKDSKTTTFFTAIGSFTLILWTAYPVVWGVADGARIASVDAEILAYAVLDVLAKPIFGFWLLFTHDATPSTALSIGGFWAHGVTNEGTIRVGDEEDGA